MKAHHLLAYLRVTSLADESGLDASDVAGVIMLPPGAVQADGTAVVWARQSLVALGLDVCLPAEDEAEIALGHTAVSGDITYRMGIHEQVLYVSRVTP